MPSHVEDQQCALLITGTVGAGKTSVAAAAGSLLTEARISHAVIDLDALGNSWPTPPEDPFNLGMELLNLQCVVGNYLSAGARRLVLAGVVETWTDRTRYRAAVGVDLRVCRLRAELPELHRRLRARHAGAERELQWHLDRAEQLDHILNRSNVQDFEVPCGDGDVTDVAIAVLTVAGWI